MNAFDELAGYRFSPGRDYDKRSVETFRARVLNLVDDLLNQVTQLQDDVADLRSREAKALEEHEAPVVPTTWLEAIAGEPDHRSPTADVVPFPVSDVPPSPGYNGGFVRPFVTSAPSEPDLVETAPAAFPAPPVMAWLADLEQPPGDPVDPVDTTISIDEPPADVTEIDEIDEIDDATQPRSSTADLLRSVPTPALPTVIVDLDAELVDLTASFHATESALVLDTAGDTDDEVLAPIVTLPVAPTPPAGVVPPSPPPPPPPPVIAVSVPPPPPAATVPPPPPPPVVTPVPAAEPVPVAAESARPAPEPVAAEPLVAFEPEPAPEPERAPEPVGVGAAVGRYERLPIVLDDGLPDDGILPAPVRHWSGWMRD